MVKKLIGFVSVTQRGYAYGLRDREGTRYCEHYVRCASLSAADIDRAYQEARSNASSLESTWKRRPDLIRGRSGFGPMPGRLPG